MRRFLRNVRSIWSGQARLRLTTVQSAGETTGCLSLSLSMSVLSPTRALVAEALEISFFMARLSNEEKNLDLKLELKEWAR